MFVLFFCILFATILNFIILGIHFFTAIYTTVKGSLALFGIKVALAPSVDLLEVEFVDVTAIT